MDNREFTQRRRNDAERARKRWEDVAGYFGPERGEEEGLTDEEDAAPYDDHFGSDDGDNLGDRPAEDLAGVVHRLAGDLVAVGRRLGDHFGGEVFGIAATASEQVG